MTVPSGRYTFRRAETVAEFEQIHALNYSTFVREIPQHEDPGDGRLVDKFHTKSLYFIALRAGRIVGMVSAHDQPPFSVASRLPDPCILQDPAIRALEIRLLAIEPQERQGVVLGGLFWELYRHIHGESYTHLLISGLEERLDLYLRLGFEPLGPAVDSGRARFVPMSMSVSRMSECNARMVRLWEDRVEKASTGRA